ncbi:MAG: 50S ribosomal protein L22 [Candidatus Improbicoccus pseudotrichonymphae]|uniref:Large ribosomal subunit protein uL22 n=1 Tax=Candidatus Improbicoccus pseudotrichonymphae TaxID=3033792 RepID=A0AA48I7P1_9FIRM|nr:MAG: 50S ribosomal protein L22 [Candidatus Improbicoccus pseudotrichonymphae]
MKASVSHVRISPRKITAILDLIRNKNANYALAILDNLRKSASPCIGKLLRSAMANAQNNKGISTSNLFVSECYVSPGPIIRRMLPVSKGRGHRILKRCSHIKIFLKEKGGDVNGTKN